MEDDKMKISKTKLRQIIKEELGTLGEEAEETALNSPGEAGRQWEAAKARLVAAVASAQGDGLSPRDIRNAIEEILSSAPDEEETIRDEPEDPFAALFHDSFGKK